MKAKDLIQILQNMNQDADIVIPALNNKGISTYALVDDAFETTVSNVWTDMQHTPGDVDMRIAKGKADEDNVIIISSFYEFGSNSSDEISQKKALDAFLQMRADAQSQQELSLEEINAEINAVRAKK